MRLAEECCLFIPHTELSRYNGENNNDEDDNNNDDDHGDNIGRITHYSLNTFIKISTRMSNHKKISVTLEYIHLLQ